jgi:hypothetical protein
MTPQEKLDAIEQLFIDYDEGDTIETDDQFITAIREIIDAKP